MIKQKILLILSLFACLQFSFAQWEECNNGLNGLAVANIAIKGNKIFAGTVGGGIFVSPDNGDNWYPKNNGMTDSTVSALAVLGNTVYAGSNKGNFYISNDEGETWILKSSGLGTSSLWSISVAGNRIYVGTRDLGIYLSTNEGESWIRKDTVLIYIRSLITTDSIIFVGTFNRGFYVSTDTGCTWLERNNGLTDIDVRALAYNGHDLFAGTSAFGIFHSMDYGLNWINELIGLSKYGSVWSIIFYGNYLFLGCYDRGVYLSCDNGETWFETNEGLTNISVTRLATNNEYIFAVTGNGIYRAKLSDFGITNVLQNNSKMDNRFVVYPNPATDYIRILLPKSKIKIYENSEIAIYNILGEKVLTKTLESETKNILTLPVKTLRTGMYSIVYRSSGTLETHKIIIIQPND